MIVPAGLTSELERAAPDPRPVTRRTTPDDADVFALVKQHMHDDHLSQSPLLVFPANLASSARLTFQVMNTTPGALTTRMQPLV